MFWDNGFKTVAAVANADPNELLPVLMQAQPNKVRLETRDENKYRDKLLAKAKVIVDSANRIWRKFPFPFLLNAVTAVALPRFKAKNKVGQKCKCGKRSMRNEASYRTYSTH